MNTYVFEAGTKKKILYAFLAGLIFLAAGILFSGSGHKETKSAEEHATVASHEVKQEAPASEMKAPAHHEEEKVVTTGTKVLANFYPLFFFGFFISLAAIFILSAATVAWGGWQVQIQKITLSITQNIF